MDTQALIQFTQKEINALPKKMVSFMENTPDFDGTNQAQVEPGGAIFPTIQAAINSIKDASEQNQYVVYISPGTFNEALTLKPWVFLVGKGPDQTMVTHPGTFNTDGLEATVIAASNSGIGSMSVSSTYAPGVLFCNGIRCDDAINFNIANVVCTVEDNASRRGALMPIYNNFGGSSTGPCNVVIASTVVVANCLNPESMANGVWAIQNGTYQIFSSKITASGNNNAIGICANPSPGSNVTVDDSVVTGVEFCLLGSSGSTLTANGCTLRGPVGPYVTVNN